MKLQVLYLQKKMCISGSRKFKFLLFNFVCVCVCMYVYIYIIISIYIYAYFCFFSSCWFNLLSLCNELLCLLVRVLKFILPYIITVTATPFWLPFTWNIFLHLFTLSPFVSLNQNWISGKEYRVRSYLFSIL